MCQIQYPKNVYTYVFRSSSIDLYSKVKKLSSSSVSFLFRLKINFSPFKSLIHISSNMIHYKVSFEALSNSSPNSSSDTTAAAAAQNLNSEFVSIYELTKVNCIGGPDTQIICELTKVNAIGGNCKVK